MLLSEIKKPLSEAIYNTIEYDLSSDKNQHEAFLARQSNLTMAELVERGVKPPKTVSVKLSDGSTGDIKVGFTAYFVIVPDESVLQKVFSKGGKTYYVVSGAVSGNKLGAKTVYFMGKDFNESPEVKKFQDQRDAATKKRNEEFQSKLQIDLREKLPPAAKMAINDGVLELVKNKEAEKLHKWFEKNGFYRRGGKAGELPIPTVEEFKKMGSLRGWSVSSGEYAGNRGSHGVEMKIDWEKREFYTQGWSSDD